MTTSKWIVYDPQTNLKVKTVTLRHTDNLHYKQLDPFDAELKKKGLSAYRQETLNQDYLKGLSFKDKIKILG